MAESISLFNGYPVEAELLNAQDPKIVFKKINGKIIFYCEIEFAEGRPDGMEENEVLKTADFVSGEIQLPLNTGINAKAAPNLILTGKDGELYLNLHVKLNAVKNGQIGKGWNIGS